MLEAEENGNATTTTKHKGLFASSTTATHKSSALQFLKRSVQNAKSAKTNVPPLYPSTVTTHYEIQPEDDDLETSSTARRPRADTMPSLSTEFPYTDRQLPYLSLSLLPSSTPPRHRSGSAVLPPPDSSQPFHSGIFSSPTWRMAHNEYVTPPTPTTDQMFKEDDTIASTMASLGLDDERRRHSSSSLHRSGSSPSLGNQSHYHPLFPPVEPSSGHSSTNLTTAATFTHHQRSSSNSESTDAAASFYLQPTASLRTSPSAVPHYLTQPGGSRPRAISLGMAESKSFQEENPFTSFSGSTANHYNRHPVWQAESSRMTARRHHGLRNSCSTVDLQDMMNDHASFVPSTIPSERTIYDDWDQVSSKIKKAPYGVTHVCIDRF
jgi:hypothetical protein